MHIPVEFGGQPVAGPNAVPLRSPALVSFAFAMTPSDQAMRQRNARRNLIHALEDLADRERQTKYKQAVAFVHVPRELLAQWGQYADLLKERREPDRA